MKLYFFVRVFAVKIRKISIVFNDEQIVLIFIIYLCEIVQTYRPFFIQKEMISQ